MFNIAKPKENQDRKGSKVENFLVGLRHTGNIEFILWPGAL